MSKQVRRHLAVFGIMQSRDDVVRARNLLQNNGYRQSDISVLMPSDDSMGNLAHERATKAPEGAAIGMVVGALLGALLAWLFKLDFIGMVEGGEVISQGRVLAILTGAGIGGTVCGMIGALIGMNTPEYEVTRYEGFAKEGGWLISVHADDMVWARRAEALLKASGARDIACTPEKIDLAMTGTDSPPGHRDYPPYF